MRKAHNMPEYMFKAGVQGLHARMQGYPLPSPRCVCACPKRYANTSNEKAKQRIARHDIAHAPTATLHRQKVGKAKVEMTKDDLALWAVHTPPTRCCTRQQQPPRAAPPSKL